ncbi:hypothetical protein D3C71_1656820 [compost metagenome]
MVKLALVVGDGLAYRPTTSLGLRVEFEQFGNVNFDVAVAMPDPSCVRLIGDNRVQPVLVCQRRDDMGADPLHVTKAIVLVRRTEDVEDRPLVVEFQHKTGLAANAEGSAVDYEHLLGNLLRVPQHEIAVVAE